MTIADAVLERLRNLPPDKQQQVLEFVQKLNDKTPSLPTKLRSPEGLLANLGTSISAEEIDDARREMWATFPRDEI
jgi:hypothetical protein